MEQEKEKKDQVYLRSENVDGKIVRKVVQKPEFFILLCGIFKAGIVCTEEEAEDITRLVHGDLYQELRKLQAMLLKYIEQNTEGDSTKLKQFVKDQVNQVWRDIVDKQKLGLDKLNVLIKKYYQEKK